MRLNNLSKYRSELMGLSALFILIFHLWMTCASSIPVIGDIEKYIRTNCYYGVDIFFILSAVGLYFSLSKSGFKGFYKKRFSKLFLPWLLASIVEGLTSKWSFIQWLKNASGFSFLFKTVYAFKWFVFAIAILYLIFPLYFKLMEKFNNKGLFTVIVLIVWIAAGILLQSFIRSDFYVFIWRVIDFIIGAYFGYLILNKDVKIPCWLVYALLVVGLALAYVINYRIVKINIVNPDFLISSPILAVSTAIIAADVFSKVNGSKLFRLWGECSFELYLFQEVIGKYVMKPLRSFLPKIGVNIAVIIIVTIVCWLIHQGIGFIEKKTFSKK